MHQAIARRYPRQGVAQALDTGVIGHCDPKLRMIACIEMTPLFATSLRSSGDGRSDLFMRCGVLLAVGLVGVGCSSDKMQTSDGCASGNGTSGVNCVAMWTTTGGKHALTFGSTYLEIDPQNGARITALRVGGSTGQDLLADSASTGELDNWGSTFWPSPQSWDWPPTDAGSINAINTLPYAVGGDGTTLTLTSSVNATVPSVSVVKKISADLAKGAIVIEYTMTNGGSAPVTVAPWEITRVPAGGITFYAGNGPPVANGLPLPPTTDAAGATWSKHDPADDTQYKLFADGQGWLAHAAADVLLIKSFPDISPAQSPAGEAEIEIYSAPKYVEVEQQGAMQTLAASESLHWTVRWYARKLTAPAVVGSADLVAYVQNQIK